MTGKRLMLRRATNPSATASGGAGAAAAVSVTATTTMAALSVGSVWRVGRQRRGMAAVSPSTAAAAASVAAVTATQRRNFFTPSPSGAELLRRLTSPSEPAKVVSPLESLRPPSPPSASDAQPFGSLNRTNSIRRYVNVNAGAEPVTAATSRGGGGAAQQQQQQQQQPSPSAMTAPPPRMELSRLLHRHGGGSSAAPASASVAVGVAGGYHSDAAAAPPAPPPPQSHAAEGSSAVARAHAAIAAAALHRTGGTAGSSNAAGASAASASRAGTCATWSSNKSNGSGSRHHSQVYKEHCTIGWSPEEFYRVVADVEQYAVFLPWCAGSEVHTSRRVRVPLGPRRLTGDGGVSWSPAAPTAAGAEELVDAIETTATLTIGFSFLKEQYTSRVTLFPGRKIVAALYDDGDDGGGAATAASPSASTGSDISGSSSSGGGGGGLVFSFLKKAAYTAGAAARRSLLKHLLCEWEFLPVEGQPNAVEVLFSVSFEFKNPLHSHMIMANVVTLMTRSFERRCETLYGPPSATKVSLPLLS